MPEAPGTYRVINPDTGDLESRFRWTVRDILDLDPFTRDLAIFDELRRLKKVEIEFKNTLYLQGVQQLEPSRR